MIAGLILAAGASSRLGSAKQRVAFRGTSLLRRTARCAGDGGCDPVLVVLGSGAGPNLEELSGLPVETVVNEAWSDGLAGSIRVGIQGIVRRPGVRAALLLACDQPLLTTAVVRRLVDRFDGAAGRIVASRYASTLGVPALFERTLFPELGRLEGDRGAKPLILRHQRDVFAVPWADGATDVDDQQDRRALLDED